MSKSILRGGALRKLAKLSLKKSEHRNLKLSTSHETTFEKKLEKVDPIAPEFVWGSFQKSEADKAFVVFRWDAPDSGDELKQLCATLGLKAIDEHWTKKFQKIVPATYLGEGTLEQIRDRMHEESAQVLVFDFALSPGQIRNLEDFFKLPVIDREGLILLIFKQNARTRLAKLQVELAHLKYLQPRLSGLWMGLSRQSGGTGGRGGRGLGETRLELDRRVIKDRISKLSKKLKEAEASRDTQAQRRGSMLRVALVGYTNSGKSTLMNALAKAKVEEKNALFSTLDTTVRELSPPSDPKILLSDTVGFVRDLPHNLVASFKSTLSEALESRLLLVVVDVTHPLWLLHIEETEKVLEEIGASHIPRLLVCNKVDSLKSFLKVKTSQAERKIKTNTAYKGVVAVSALQGEGVSELRLKLMDILGASECKWRQNYAE